MANGAVHGRTLAGPARSPIASLREDAGLTLDRDDIAVLVADSDEVARQELADLLLSAGAAHDVVLAGDARQCMRFLTEGAYDVLFLNVRLRGLGAKRAVQIASTAPAQVVLLMEVDANIANAFGTSVESLLKPIRQDRLQLTLTRLFGPTELRPAQSEGLPVSPDPRGRPTDRLAVFAAGRIRLIPVEIVQFVEVRDRRIYVQTQDESFETHLTLEKIEQRHRVHGFIRVHRQYVVNIHHIDVVDPSPNNTYTLLIRNRHSLRIPVSRRRSRELREMLRI